MLNINIDDKSTIHYVGGGVYQIILSKKKLLDTSRKRKMISFLHRSCNLENNHLACL